MLPPLEALARSDWRHAQSRCHSYNFQIVKDQAGEPRYSNKTLCTHPGHNLPAWHFTALRSVERSIVNGQRPARQYKSLLEWAALPASGHSSLQATRGLPPVSLSPSAGNGPFSRNAEYSGSANPCQTLTREILRQSIPGTRGDFHHSRGNFGNHRERLARRTNRSATRSPTAAPWQSSVAGPLQSRRTGRLSSGVATRRELGPNDTRAHHQT